MIKAIDTLEEVSARIDTISNILSDMQSSFFDVDINTTEYKELYNWHVSNFNMVKNVLWELSRSLEEQSELIDEVVKESIRKE